MDDYRKGKVEIRAGCVCLATRRKGVNSGKRWPNCRAGPLGNARGQSRPHSTQYAAPGKT